MPVNSAGHGYLAAYEADEPPLRVLLGGAALKVALARLDALRDNFDAWAESSKASQSIPTLVRSAGQS
uniref:hypothetical protein n=1 Tax=Burkholderia anthina TaxID=179879 RepID=UPI00158CEE4E|nr:hypothetical protein [Burkholderia anthina]